MTDDNNRYKEPQTAGDLRDIIAGFVHKAQSEFYGAKQIHPSDPGETIAELLGATLAKLKNGQRQPMNKTAKNPMEEEPTAMAMRYFGQGPTHKIQIDKVFPKIIGVFVAEQGGAGSSAFNFSNLPSFGQAMQLVDVVAKVVTGGGTISSDSSMIPSILSTAQNVASIIGNGVDLHTLVDMSRPDHMIPMMNAISSAFGGMDQAGLFGEDIFADGYKFAGAVQGHLADLTGGSTAYSRILDTVASGDIDTAVTALSTLAGQSASVANLVSQVRNIQNTYEAPNIQQKLSQIAIPTAQTISTIASTLDAVQHLTPLEGASTIISNVLPAMNNVANVVDSITGANSLGQLQNAVAGLQNFSGALSQLGNLSGTIQSLGNFGNLSANLSNLANLPKALGNAINSLNMTPDQMAQSLLSQTANEQLQILGHIAMQAGKF